MMKNIFLTIGLFCFTLLSANVVNVNRQTGTYQVDQYGSDMNKKTMTPTKNELEGTGGRGYCHSQLKKFNLK